MQATRTHKRHTSALSLFASFYAFVALVSYCGSGCSGADGTSIVFAVSTRERLIDARFDVALRLTTHRCEFRNYQIA